MKLSSIPIALLFLLSSLNAISQDKKITALTGVSYFSPNGEILSEMTIIIEGDKIIDIFKDNEKAIPGSVTTIDVTGYYVVPGFIDTHVHMGQRGLPESPVASRKEFEKWIYSGVTSVRDMGGDARLLYQENQRIAKNEQPGPDIYYTATVASSDMVQKDMRLKNSTQGIGISEAGYVIEAKQGMNIQESIQKAKESKVTGLKFYAGISAKLINDITHEAHENGLKSWSHFTVFPDRPMEILRAEVDVVSHVWGAFWQDKNVDPSLKIPFTHTSFNDARAAIFPGDLSVLDPDSPETKMLFKEMVRRNVIWDVTYVVPNPGTMLLYNKYLRSASKEGVSFSTGTDYFNPVSEPYPSLFKEIERLVSDSILNTRQVLLAATLNGAKVLGIENTHGSIATGKIANLVVLRKNPLDDIRNIREIVFTMKNGKIYSRSDYK